MACERWVTDAEMGDGEADTDDAEMERADERANELHDELRAEHDRQIDDDVRRAEADYLNPRN